MTNNLLAIITAVLAVLCFILPCRDLLLKKSTKGWRRITQFGWVLLALGCICLLVSVLGIIKSQHDKDIDDAKSTNVGRLDPGEAEDSQIEWILGGQPFYFNSGDIDLNNVAFGNRGARINPFEGIDFKAKLEDHKIKVSTTIRDSSGNIITQLVDNEWVVNKPQYAFDRNFNDTSLEVKDNLGDIVFQIEVSGGKMFMNAKFVKPDGELLIAFPIKKAMPNMPGLNGIVNYEPGHYKWASRFKFSQFIPMFKYPSGLHPMERLPRSIDTFSGIRFENVPPYPSDIKDSSKNYLFIRTSF